MKLFAKYNRINVLSTVVIFLIGSIAFAILLRYVVINQIDQDLEIEHNEIEVYIDRYHALPPLVKLRDQYTTYMPVSSTFKHNTETYSENFKKNTEHEIELARTIKFVVDAGGKRFLVTVSKSLEGTDNLIQTIIFITLCIILLILTATFIINRLVLRKLWQPFYKTLQIMQHFNLADKNNLSFINSNIDEFNLLNLTLSDAVNKAQNDYASLKEFTENASHELQTPLAVIRSKLDLLIQNEDLSKQQSVAIQGAYNAVQSLSKLSQSLLLLTKIENNQFSEKTSIDMTTILKEKLLQFQELWLSEGIAVTEDIGSTSIISANAQLIEILLNNLLSNATKHNIANGFLKIELKANKLLICNTGNDEALNAILMFTRFYKVATTKEQHGLGLSIIKQICLVSQLAYHYNFTSPNLHEFVISW